MITVSCQHDKVIMLSHFFLESSLTFNEGICDSFSLLYLLSLSLYSSPRNLTSLLHRDVRSQIRDLLSWLMLTLISGEALLYIAG
jgi:hypothetical protein